MVQTVSHENHLEFLAPTETNPLHDITVAVANLVAPISRNVIGLMAGAPASSRRNSHRLVRRTNIPNRYWTFVPNNGAIRSEEFEEEKRGIDRNDVTGNIRAANKYRLWLQTNRSGYYERNYMILTVVFVSRRPTVGNIFGRYEAATIVWVVDMVIMSLGRAIPREQYLSGE
jgi:hypothetical protein